MKNSTEFLPDDKRLELNKIVGFIEEHYTKVNAIILYGNYANETWKQKEQKAREMGIDYKEKYKLLIVMSSEPKAKRVNFQNALIEDLNTHLYIKTPFKLIFHGYEYICSMLKNHNFFFYDVMKEGILLSNTWEREFRLPEKMLNEVRVMRAEENYNDWMRNANEMFAQYKLSFDSGNYRIASFFLQQTAEIYMQTVCLVLTEYRPRIHKLTDLLECICDEDSRFESIFPFNTDESKRVFKLLNNAYSKSRYDVNFTVKIEELIYLQKRVELLAELSKISCEEKLKAL